MGFETARRVKTKKAKPSPVPGRVSLGMVAVQRFELRTLRI